MGAGGDADDAAGGGEGVEGGLEGGVVCGVDSDGWGGFLGEEGQGCREAEKEGAEDHGEWESDERESGRGWGDG